VEMPLNRPLKPRQVFWAWMGRVLGFFCCVALLALAGCGSSSDKTTKVGTSEVTVSGDTPTETFSQGFEAMIEKAPYLPWFARCVEGQVEHALTPAKEKELGELPKAEAERRMFDLIVPAAEACQVEGRKYIDPHATADELGLLRSGEQIGVGQLLKRRGASPKAVACLEKEVGAMESSDLVALIEGSEAVGLSILKGLAEHCK
jgi:hypothetical protein